MKVMIVPGLVTCKQKGRQFRQRDKRFLIRITLCVESVSGISADLYQYLLPEYLNFLEVVMSIKRFGFILFMGFVTLFAFRGYSQTRISIGGKGWYAFWSATPSDVSTSTDKGIGEADITPGYVLGPNALLRFNKVSFEVNLYFGSFHFDYGNYGHYFEDNEDNTYEWDIEDFNLTGKRTDFSLIAGYHYARNSVLHLGIRELRLEQKSYIHYTESIWTGSMWKYEREGENWYVVSDTKSLIGVGMSFTFVLLRNKLYLPLRLLYFTNKLQEGYEIWDGTIGIELHNRSRFTFYGGYRVNLSGITTIEETFHGIQAGIRYQLPGKRRNR
jgi:hypothetical protein